MAIDDTARSKEESAERYTIKDHWKCMAACLLLSLCPFQYGLDFGLIGGMQAMVGFLQVRPLPGLYP